MMKMPGMYSCSEVHQLVASSSREDLGTWDRVRFRMHLLMCHHCARYVRQIEALGASMRRLFGGPVDPERVKRLEAAVMAHCDGHGH